MRLFLIILMIPFSLFAFHEHDENDESYSSKNEVLLEETLNSAEPTLKYIYNTVNSVAKSVDEFLSNDYSDEKYYDSYIHIETSMKKIEGYSTDFDANVDIRIKLKKTSKKYRLVINNSDDNVSDEFKDHNETVPFEDDDYNIGIEYQSFKKYINFKSNLGIKASTNPYIYIKASASKEFKLSKRSSYEIEQKLRYSDRFELDSTTSLAYHKKLDDTYTFVNQNKYFINSKEQVDNIYNSLRINQQLNQRDYINYVAALNSNNDESNFQDKRYRAYISYRKFLKKWMYYDLIPEVSFNRDDNFEERYGFTVNIGILIDK